ncbi:MAG: hypothetical protein R6V05_10210 [Candidatus Brocadiia bacterium]
MGYWSALQPTAFVGLVVFAALLLSTGCAGAPHRDNPQTAYVVSDDGARLAQYAPMFVLQTWAEQHNRIGAPAVRREGGEDTVWVDHARPIVYGRERPFQTEGASYTNLIYRVHFPRIPLPHLTVGRNVGLLVIITLDEAERPVLLTTVHTCGCYLAFVPTSYLPPAALPEDWEAGAQEVHGETLPGRLNYPPEFAPRYRPAIFVRDGTHRVMDVRLVDLQEAQWRYRVVPAELAPIESLDALPTDGGTTSFFETSGPRKGFVKGSSKPLERLLISWWALDWRVGQDKRYGPADQMNTILYTSLKPWRRKASDMWPFAEFLRYWGWRL